MARKKLSDRPLSGRAIANVNFSMIPRGPRTMVIKDSVIMDDNLDEGERTFLMADQVDQSVLPIHLMIFMTVFCKEGGMSVTLDGREYNIRSGDFLIIKPGVILQKIVSSPDSTCRLAIFSGDAEVGHVSPQIPQDSVLAFVRIIVNSGSVVMLHFDERLSALYESMYKSQRQIFAYVDEQYLYDSVFNFISATATLVASFVKNSPHSEALSEQLDRRAVIFQRFMTEVHQNLYNERGVSFYAQKQFMSPKYFSGVITEASGHNPTYWIKRAVVLEAKALLSSGQYTIQQVSSKLNFPNPSFFGKYFKSVEGTSPGEFVKTVR